MAIALGLLATPALAGPKVFSLDQCADQYALALSARADIVGLSKRATKSDSYLAARARGLPMRRATIEEVLAARPDVVVRWWGGDERLLGDLTARGVRIARIDDASDFEGIRANVRRVAGVLGARAEGEALIAHMDRQLAQGRGAWGGDAALYLTSGGDTAGRGTLIDAMLSAAGLSNLAPGHGYQAVPLEQLVTRPPSAVVQGFFDPAAAASQRWSIGHHEALQRLLAGRTVVSLPAAILACPAWFAGDAVELIARARNHHPPSVGAWLGTGREASRVAPGRATTACTHSCESPTLTASPSVPPHAPTEGG